MRSTSIASRRPRKRSGLVGGDSKAFVVWRSAFSDFASSSETPEATSDKAAMSAFSDFDPSFETPASFVGRVGVSWTVGEMHKDW